MPIEAESQCARALLIDRSQQALTFTRLAAELQAHAFAQGNAPSVLKRPPCRIHVGFPSGKTILTALRRQFLRLSSLGFRGFFIGHGRFPSRIAIFGRRGGFKQGQPVGDFRLGQRFGRRCGRFASFSSDCPASRCVGEEGRKFRLGHLKGMFCDMDHPP